MRKWPATKASACNTLAPTTKGHTVRVAEGSAGLSDVLQNNKVLRTAQVDIPHCVHDVLGGLLTLRGSPLEPGQSTLAPMSDGRRSAQVKVEAQEREEVTTPAGTFKTIRYETNLMNGVIYQRKGRAFVWISDDARRIPVQIRLRLAFPIGTITLQLQKENSK